MPSVGVSFMILGLLVASAFGNNISTEFLTQDLASNVNETTASDFISSTTTTDDGSTILPAGTTQNGTSTNPVEITSTPTATSNYSTNNNTVKPSTATTKKGDGGKIQSTMSPATPKTTVPSKTTFCTSSKGNDRQNSDPATGNYTGIIILIVIILLIAVFGLACFFAKRRARRYSVDSTCRPDEANIPLSTIDPDMPIEASSQNGLQTFESTEAATMEPQEPGATHEVQKTEADKSVVDPSAESATPNPPAGTSEDKPKEVVPEQSPPAPVEPSVDEKTDEEDLGSNKTSVESLKETNENNSNNADWTTRGVKLSNVFWDVPLNSPV